MRVLDRFGLVAFPIELVRLLQYGRVVDTSRLHDELGFVPERGTIDTVLEHGRRRRVRGLVDDAEPYRYEHELEEFLRSRGRRGEDNGPPRPRAASAPTVRARRRRSPQPTPDAEEAT
jgi:hypothetical protein